MKKLIAVGNINIDGQNFSDGQEISGLSGKQCAELLKQGLAKEASEAPPAPKEEKAEE